MAPSPHDADLAPGTIVGDYRVDRPIGVGGMGVVYEATQPMIGKRVALKVLHRHLCRDRGAVQRFVQEARAVNRIGHASIVDVFGFGTTDDDRAFLVMELLVGETLASRLRREAMSLEDSREILVEVAHALAMAHDAGVIHRDLKPENVFLVRRPRSIKLLDFGIAKLIVQRAIAGELTQPGVLVGTPNYLSPEQALGLSVDPRTDIYSLGVVAFEMVTGRLPFTGIDARELLGKHARLRPPDVAALRPGVPPAISELIAAMLEKDPARRPGLDRVRDVLGTTAATAPDAPKVVHEPLAATEVLERPRRSRRMLVAAGIAVAVVAAISVARRGRDPDPAPAPAPTVAPAPAPLPVADVPIVAPAPPPIAVPARRRPAKPVEQRRAKPAPRPEPATVAAPRAAVPEDDDAVRSPFTEGR